MFQVDVQSGEEPTSMGRGRVETRLGGGREDADLENPMHTGPLLPKLCRGKDIH